MRNWTFSGFISNLKLDRGEKDRSEKHRGREKEKEKNDYVFITARDKKFS